MRAKDFLRIAQEKARAGSIRLSFHAQQEALNEEISVDDILNALQTGRVLEPYPEDPRGASCLFVGTGRDARWIHVLAGAFDQRNLVIITVYRPNPPKWVDPFTRGGERDEATKEQAE